MARSVGGPVPPIREAVPAGGEAGLEEGPAPAVAVSALQDMEVRAMIVTTRLDLMRTLLETHPHTQVEELVRRARGAEEYILGGLA